MKILVFIILVCSALITPKEWNTDFDAAQKIAKEKHQPILLTFSGSDWCGPCIKLKRTFFDSEAFNEFADSIVLLDADFPRNKKNQLSKEQGEKNEKLADNYNSDGKFPYTLLLTPEGSIIKAWDGLPDGSVQDFIGEIRAEVITHSF